MREPARLRQHFLAWQCRIRQHAMRRAGGRPSPGMCPRVLSREGREIAPALTLLLLPRAPQESTAFFRHQLRKSHDPRLVYERGLAYLQAGYFQDPAAFSDEMTALFHGGSAVARALAAEGRCILEFAQFRQSYRISCTLAAATPGSPAFEATVWHNRIFNPNMPGEVHVLVFRPDWRSAQADPDP